MHFFFYCNEKCAVFAVSLLLRQGVVWHAARLQLWLVCLCFLTSWRHCRSFLSANTRELWRQDVRDGWWRHLWVSVLRRRPSALVLPPEKRDHDWWYIVRDDRPPVQTNDITPNILLPNCVSTNIFHYLIGTTNKHKMPLRDIGSPHPRVYNLTSRTHPGYGTVGWSCHSLSVVLSPLYSALETRNSGWKQRCISEYIYSFIHSFIHL